MLSLTAISGRPTRMTFGKPAETSTSTSTGKASMPTRAKAFSLASMAVNPAGVREQQGTARLPFSEEEINSPATTDVRSLAAAVLDQLLVIAASVFESVC